MSSNHAHCATDCITILGFYNRNICNTCMFVLRSLNVDGINSVFIHNKTNETNSCTITVCLILENETTDRNYPLLSQGWVVSQGSQGSVWMYNPCILERALPSTCKGLLPCRPAIFTSLGVVLGQVVAFGGYEISLQFSVTHQSSTYKRLCDLFGEIIAVWNFV